MIIARGRLVTHQPMADLLEQARESSLEDVYLSLTASSRGRHSRHTPQGEVMRSLVAAELLKVRTTRAAWVASALVLAYAVLGPVLMVLAPAGASIPPIEPALLAESLRTPARLAGAAVLLIGILGTTAEFGHGTVLTTRLAEPRSTRVLAAKLIAVALVAVVLTIVLAVAVDGCDLGPARVPKASPWSRSPTTCRGTPPPSSRSLCSMACWESPSGHSCATRRPPSGQSWCGRSSSRASFPL